MEKVITIIIPSYNMENYIAHCCNSLIVPQALLDKIEIIVVNDGSKDNTSIIAHEFQNNYPNSFVVVDKENGNYGSCINAGLKIANGKYVKILDADDSFDTSVFMDYIGMLEKTDADLILSDFDIVDPNGKVTQQIEYSFPSNDLLGTEQISSAYVDSFAMHAVAYKHQKLRNLNYYQSEGISYTDQEWIFLPMFNVKTFIHFNKPLYKYLIGRQGQTVSEQALKKSTGQGMIIAKKIINDYLNHSDCITKESNEYVQSKLRERCKTQYMHYLLNYKNYVDFNALIEFDDFLKEKLPDVYEEMSQLVDFNSFRYVDYWRQCHSVSTARFKLFYAERMVYYFFKSIFSFIKKVILAPIKVIRKLTRRD